MIDSVYENTKAIEVTARFEYADNCQFGILVFDLATAIGQFEGTGHTVTCSGASMEIGEDGILQLMIALGGAGNAN